MVGVLGRLEESAHWLLKIGKALSINFVAAFSKTLRTKCQTWECLLPPSPNA